MKKLNLWAGLLTMMLVFAVSASSFAQTTEAKAKTAKKAKKKTAKKAAATTATAAAMAAFKVQPQSSNIHWYGYKVTGKHDGTVMLKNGELKFDGDKLTGGMFEVDLTTIKTTDLSGEYATKLEGHLKADDFFGVEKFPTATFIIKKVTDNGGGKYTVLGDMTIKGVTKEMTLDTDVMTEGAQKIASTKIKIDRTQFGLKYGSASFFDKLGDKAINNDFDLDVKVVASK